MYCCEPQEPEAANGFLGFARNIINMSCEFRGCHSMICSKDDYHEISTDSPVTQDAHHADVSDVSDMSDM